MIRHLFPFGQEFRYARKVLRWTGRILLGVLLSYGCAVTHTPERSAWKAEPNFEQMFPFWRPGPGWRLDGQPSVYVPSNLYDYIDGQAELYLSYGFQRLVTGTFVKATAPDEFIVADVYDMGKKLHAFGVYSVYEDEDWESLDAGAAGFRGDRFFALYKGPYFALITAETADQAAGERLARLIAGSIPGDSDPPSELRYLPEKNLIQGTLRYTPEGLFGYGFLPRGIEGRYRTAQDPIVLFVVFCGSETEASTALERYRAYVEQERAFPTQVDDLGEEGFFGEEPYHAGLMVVRSGRFLVGTRDLDEPSGLRIGKERIREILERIQE